MENIILTEIEETLPSPEEILRRKKLLKAAFDETNPFHHKARKLLKKLYNLTYLYRDGKEIYL